MTQPLWRLLTAGAALFISAGALTNEANADVNGDGKTVICFVGHQTSHGFGKHEYSAGNHLIEELLKKAYPEANIEGRHAIPWPEDEEAFYKDADAVVFFCTGGPRHVVNGNVPEFDKVMRTGAGLACLHYGVEVPIGPSAKGMLAWMGGYFETHWSVNPHWIAEFESFSDHEAARGIEPFKMDDEWYFHMRFVEGMKGVEPILSAIAPDETMKRPDGPHHGNPTVRKAVADKQPQHVAWAYQRGENYKNGRGYGFTGLHYHWNWEDPNFRKTVLNGVAWTAKLAIPENGIESAITREELEANALKYGGAQTKPAKKKPAPKKTAPKKTAAVNPNAKPLFESDVISNGKTPGHAVPISVDLPKSAKELYLRIDDLDRYTFDWANWGEARFVMSDGSEKKLADLEWSSAASGWGAVRKNLNAGGKAMRVLGKPVKHGIGAHAPSLVSFAIPKGAQQFKATGQLDDGGTTQQGGAAPSSVKFAVFIENPGAAQKSSSAVAPSADRAPEDALASLDVHEALDVQLFASEPMITSPSSIDIDSRGRVWVCDVVNYRRNQGKREGGDKIVILEDTDGDAKADKSTVFYQGADVDSAHGICVLGDRVIISVGDEVFSLYDRDGDGKADPDSKEMLFTKIGGKQHDHGIHAVHFGPDGKLYFNFGNAGKQLCDAEGNLITDINGTECRVDQRPFQQGMVFRCDLDGSNVEMLGWNFRNNWEVCVDAFGTMWQSDNDDDGNKGVRINYVMDYGNFGYRDEMTGAGWRDPRPGMSDDIPERHWHLNDPGVVPNLLQTGAGSPTGICVYEGELLPEIFQNQVIHCDAGPNVVRAYVREKDGAGYQAEMVDILRGARDNWFRPSDVCTAPDGSLFVADWYDPGVGGHGMRDLERGRIFRVIPKGKAQKYQPASPQLDSGEGAFAAMNSACMATRYLGWQAAAEKALPEPQKLREKARSLYRMNATIEGDWAPDKETSVHGNDPDLLLVILRMIR
ncbi:MAG: PVC-type heme-binding CxxCH protein, partial [Verrucomicrobiota bacterium]